MSSDLTYHPSHDLIAYEAPAFDYACSLCGETDATPTTERKLREECPKADQHPDRLSDADLLRLVADRQPLSPHAGRLRAIADRMDSLDYLGLISKMESVNWRGVASTIFRVTAEEAKTLIGFIRKKSA